MTNKIYVEKDVYHLNYESFDNWREAMDEFEAIHCDCTLDFISDLYNGEEIKFTGFRDKNEHELEQERKKEAEAERKRLIAEKDKARDEAARQKERELRGELMSDPEYDDYCRLLKKFRVNGRQL